MSSIEENLKVIADYLKGLDKISYEEVVDMLTDTDNYYQIDFYTDQDILNDKQYSCVSIVKNFNTNTKEEYLSADQDVFDVYTNLISTFKEKKVEPIFQMLPDYFGHYEFVCSIGDNVLIFPRKIVRELLANASDHSNSKSNDIVCIFDDKELLLPSSLSSKDMKKEKVKDKK